MKLEGTVTFCDPKSNPPQCYLQVGDNGIALRRPTGEALDLNPGDRVKVTGLIESDPFLPVVKVDTAERLTTGPLPEPKPVFPTELQTGAYNGDWVKFDGLVIAVDTNLPQRLEIASNAGRCQAVFPTSMVAPLSPKLLGSDVSFQAVCNTKVNAKGVPASFRFLVLQREDVLMDIMDDPSVRLRQPIKRLPPFSLDEQVPNRVNYRGVLTLVRTNGLVVIQEGNDGLRVQLLPDKSRQLKVGDEIAVTGFPVPGGYGFWLESGFVVDQTNSVPPPPIALRLTNHFGNLDGSLVQVRARLAEHHTFDDQEILVLYDERERQFEAFLEHAPGTSLEFTNYRPGSELRLTGIYEALSRDRFNVDGMRLLLRDAADVKLLKAGPWWNPTRAVTVASTLALLVGLSAAWGAIQSRLVRVQKRQLEIDLERERALELRYQDIATNAVDAIFTMTPDGRLQASNPALRRLTGLSASELPGCDFGALVVPDQRDSFRRRLQQTSDTDREAPLGVDIVARDHRRVSLEIASRRVRSREGVLHVEAVARDVTERRRAEEALRASEERLRACIEITPNVCVQWFDNDGRVIFWNHASEVVFGWPAPDCLGRTLEHLCFSADQARDFHSLLREIEATGKPRGPFEQRFHRRNGSEAVGITTVFAIPTHEGNPCFVAMTVDLTAKKLIEEALRDAKETLEARVTARTAELKAINQELTDFASAVTHDLKAPLRGISNLAEWIDRDHDDLKPEVRQMFRLIQQRVRHMQDLIDGLLAYTRIGRTAERDSDVNTQQMVERVIEFIAAPPQVTVVAATELPVIRGPGERLHQVFQNLVDNAIKYMDKPAGRVEISARRLDAGWEFAVADNGPGIDPRQHARVFEIFHKAHTRRDISSNGIGLAIVKRVIEAHGGRVWVESTVKQGATFRFTWPDKTPPPLADEEPQPTAAAMMA